MRIEKAHCRPLDNYLILLDEFRLASRLRRFYITRRDPSVCYPTYSFDKTSRKPTEDCLCPLDGRVGSFLRASWPLLVRYRLDDGGKARSSKKRRLIGKNSLCNERFDLGCVDVFGFRESDAP